MKIIAGQGVQSMLQYVVQYRGAEGVAGAGGLDDAAQRTGGLKHEETVIVGIAALGTGGDVQQADVGEAPVEQGGTLVKVRLTGHEQQLIVGDLQDVAALQAPEDLLPGVIGGIPQGQAQIGVKGDEGAAVPGHGQSPACGSAAGLVRQGQGAEVEDPAVAQEADVQVLRREHDIGAGLAVEAEVPVAAGQGADHGQRGGDVVVPEEAAAVDAGIPQGLGQHIAESVPAHLAHEGTLFAQLAEHGQHVGGGAAGVGLKEGIALGTGAGLGKVHQQLAESHYVKLSVVHIVSPLRSKVFDAGIDAPPVQHQDAIAGACAVQGAGVEKNGEGAVFQTGLMGVAEEDHVGTRRVAGGTERLQRGIVLDVAAVAVGGKDGHAVHRGAEGQRQGGEQVAVAPDGVDDQVREGPLHRCQIGLTVAQKEAQVRRFQGDGPEHGVRRPVGIGKDADLHAHHPLSLVFYRRKGILSMNRAAVKTAAL